MCAMCVRVWKNVCDVHVGADIGLPFMALSRVDSRPQPFWAEEGFKKTARREQLMGGWPGDPSWHSMVDQVEADLKPITKESS